MADLPPTVTEDLQLALDAALERERKLRAALNRWQMLEQSALGSIQRIVQEVQIFLRDGELPEVNEK